MTAPTLTIITKRPALGSWVTPRAEINGHPVPLTWGTNTVGAPPGVHRIMIFMPWLWRYGQAEITVDNSAGPAPAVYYAMPYVAFLRGAIGLEPVANPGLVAFLAILVVPLLLLVLCCAGAALLGN